MSKGLEALKYLDEHNLNWHDNPTKKYVDIIEKELKALELIRKCFYVAKSSGAILLTDYGFDHEEELREVLL